jgi:ParD-like antitoxin of type II bacterial toxin-antitoxin system
MTAVNLDNNLIEAARAHSAIEHRSIAKQIEHWARIGKIVEENPNSGLSYAAIKGILLGLEDVKAGRIEEYKPGSL